MDNLLIVNWSFLSTIFRYVPSLRCCKMFEYHSPSPFIPRLLLLTYNKPAFLFVPPLSVEHSKFLRPIHHGCHFAKVFAILILHSWHILVLNLTEFRCQILKTFMIRHLLFFLNLSFVLNLRNLKVQNVYKTPLNV